jgi:hypothetical protein
VGFPAIAGRVFLYFVFILFFQGVVAYIVYEFIIGNKVSIRESMARVFSRMGWLLIFGFATLLLFGLCLGMLLGVIGQILDNFARYYLIVFLVPVPVIVMMCITVGTYYVSVSECVVEQTVEFRKRDRRISAYFFNTTCMFVPVFVIIAIILGIVNFVIVRAMGDGFVAYLTGLLSNTILIAFVNVMSAVVYHAIKMKMENLTAKSLNGIFD